MARKIRYSNPTAGWEYSLEWHGQQKNITCTSINCPSPNSCENGSVCVCDNTLANAQIDTTTDTYTDSIYCQYQRKKQLTAFLLEFFLPFGIGHLYLGRLKNGIIKLVLLFVLCCSLCFLPSTEDKKVVYCLFSAFISLLLIWNLMDLIFIGLNRYVDGNKVLPQKW